MIQPFFKLVMNWQVKTRLHLPLGVLQITLTYTI